LKEVNVTWPNYTVCFPDGHTFQNKKTFDLGSWRILVFARV